MAPPSVLGGGKLSGAGGLGLLNIIFWLLVSGVCHLAIFSVSLSERPLFLLFEGFSMDK